MCTLIALHRCHATSPLVIAANRDEYLDRPAAGPAVRGIEGLPGRSLVAPRDLREGGTWLGVNDAGLFAAITNRPTRSRDDSRRSRGLLVLDALASESALGAARALESLPANAYNPFNLFLADAAEAFAVVYEDKPSVTPLAPGVHVIGNADPDDRRVPKVARLLDEAEAVAGEPPEAWLPGLAALCRGHHGEGGPLAPTCIHAGGYGTHSSTLLRLGSEPAGHVLRFAEGPPCEAGYVDFTHLLRELPRASGIDAGTWNARGTG